MQEVARAVGGPGRVAWDDALAAVDMAAAALVTALSDLADALVALDGGESLQQCAARVTVLAGELDAMLHATPGQGARLLGREQPRIQRAAGALRDQQHLAIHLASATRGSGVRIGDAGGGRGFLAFHAPHGSGGSLRNPVHRQPLRLSTPGVAVPA